MLHRSGLPTTFGTVVELGPGDSLGTGLAALLSGAERYVALDVVRYADPRRNRQILEELIALFRDRAPIPDQTEFLLLQPPLSSYAFPADVLTSARIDASSNPERLAAIRASLAMPSCNPRDNHPVCYIVPWHPGTIDSGTADLVFSHAVLQYSENVAELCAEMARWLKPGGLMSHEIDFKSLGVTTEWNGHWGCSEMLWRAAMGHRRHRPNREPHSTYVTLLTDAGCRVACDERTVRYSGISRDQLAPRFRHLTDEDLVTSSALIQVAKSC